MPRYRTKSGVVVSVPVEKAARLNGLIPIETPPSPTRRRRTRKPKPTPETTTE